MVEAKKRLVVNVVTNILVVVVNTIINLWMTPYLIRNLGLGIYGMIPLVISFIAYFNVLTVSFANTVSRYIAIYLNKKQIEETNIFFSSAAIGLGFICLIVLIPIIVMACSFSKIFQVTKGFEKGAGWLFFLIMISSLFMVLRVPFRTGTFVKHRFDLYNLNEICGRIIRVVVLVVCFTYLSPKMEYFGLSYLMMCLFAFIFEIFLASRLTPELKIKSKLFSWTAIWEMSKMSFWLSLNQAGALMYLATSYIVINIFLGPYAVGMFAPIALWVTLLGTFAGSFCSVFSPIALEYIAKERLDLLVIQTCRSVKFIGIIMAIPVGILCGLSSPILKWWLGQEFSELSSLVWLLIMPWIVTVSVRPMFGIFSGMDKVKIPALVTIFIGIVNLLLSILLITITDLGIYSVAVSLLFCWTGKNMFFTPIYAAIITGQPKSAYVKEFLPGILVVIITSLLLLMLDQLFYMVSFMRLLTASVSVALLISIISYKLILNSQDKDFLWSLFFKTAKVDNCG
ncbi:MAG: oligosaccharide flippase family protein [Sedimentisphaerales bacterium]|nr:oligosaccharide flippase family protein [Sedimentisphaerales bacterium]